jgi:hypothetical protein
VLAAAIITAVATVALAVVAVFQIRAGQEQTAAALTIARESREAAQRQWQPRVFAQPRQAPFRDRPTEQMMVPCYLVNEGTGPAFNVELGVGVAGTIHRYEGGQWWAMRAGEFMPPVAADSGQPIPEGRIVVTVPLDAWDPDDYVYWTHFENLLGERFEVRVYPDPKRPPDFRPLSTAVMPVTEQTSGPG